MTEIGRLKAHSSDDLSRLYGQIQTLATRLSIRLDGNVSLCDAREPSHRIFGRIGSGPEIQVGSAWLKTAKHGPRKGERFLSLSVDYPGSSGPLNVAAFADPDSDDWVIVWRRRGVQNDVTT